MNIYDLPHTFIVFHPGAAGNFLAGLINNVTNGAYAPLAISTSGSSHTIIDRKILGVDYLSLGFDSLENDKFSNIADRLNYYVQRIDAEHSDLKTPQITWSHDFTNIPLYKQLFPNSRVIAITHNSNIEKLIVTCMHVTKNILDNNAVIPMPTEMWQPIRQTLYAGYADEMTRLNSFPSYRAVAEVVHKPEYAEAVAYVAIMRMLRYYGLLHLVEPSILPENDVMNHVLFPLPTRIPSYRLGNPCSDYLASDTILLAYNDLLHDPSKVIAVISQICTLNAASEQYIISSCQTYAEKQNQQLISDPIGYYQTIKKLGVINLDKLSRELT